MEDVQDCFKSHCPAPDLPGGLRRYAFIYDPLKSRPAHIASLFPLYRNRAVFCSDRSTGCYYIHQFYKIFHHVPPHVFTNDLWILDPTTDMLINIVPEGFFMDTAGRIAFLFGALSLILFGICLIMTLKNKRR